MYSSRVTDDANENGGSDQFTDNDDYLADAASDGPTNDAGNEEMAFAYVDEGDTLNQC